MQSLSMKNFRRNFLASTGAATLIATQGAIPAAFATDVNVTTCPDFDGLVTHIGDAGANGTVSFNIATDCTITITDEVVIDETYLRIENVSDADLTFVRYADFNAEGGNVTGINSFGQFTLVEGGLVLDNIIFDGKFDIDFETLTYTEQAGFPYLEEVFDYNAGPSDPFVNAAGNSLEFHNSVFRNNLAIVGLVGSYDQANLTIDNSTFEYNLLERPAIYADDTPNITVSNSYFESNVNVYGNGGLEGLGGAIGV